MKEYHQIGALNEPEAYRSKISTLQEEIKLLKSKLLKEANDSQHSHDLMSYVIEHNRGAVAVHDRDMRYIYVSQRYLTDYQIKEKDIIGKHHYEVFPDLPQKWKIAHQEALKGKVISREDDIYERKDGTVEWTRWECRPWYEADKSIGGIIIYTEVITERKRIELALKNSEMQLNALFNSAPVIMILIDEETRVLKMNKFGLESTGRNIESLTGLKPGDVLRCVNSFKSKEGCGATDDCKSCAVRNTIISTFSTGKEYYKIEAELVSLNKKEIQHTILVSTSVISTTPEKQVLLTIDDITERKELEKELIKARDRAEESDNLKSAFLANISHEIRTPMNGIMGFSEMLSKPNLTDEKRNQFSLLIREGCMQLLGVINDVIEISMIDTDQMTVTKTDFSLHEFMQDIFLMFRSEANNRNLNIYYKAPDRRLEIKTDREKLKHVFSNLVSNAIKFTKQGHIEFGYIIENNNIEFFVKDTGIGIKKELHSAIFERFRQAEISDTRNYNGTGLGLSISKGLINLLGGEIRIESEPCRGTTFFFSIPGAIVNAAAKSVIKDSVLSCNEILIAEDDEINFLFMQEVLEEMNYIPIHACNGLEAVRLLNENPSVKLVLMDIKMPVMDGYEATREIRNVNKNIPIIAQTAFSFTGTRSDLIKWGFDDSISKPIDKAKLETIIKKYVQTCI